MASKILARVEEVRIKAGQEVNEGDVLVVLDSTNLKARLDQATAAEAAAKARFDQAKIDLGRAERLKARQTITQSESTRPAPPCGRRRPNWIGPGRQWKKPGLSSRTPP